MEVITIDKLPKVEELTKDDLIPINQKNVTKNVNLEKINDFIHAGTMGPVNELIANEATARMQGDNDTLKASKEYTDEEIKTNKLAVNEWLAPVKTVSQIPKTGLDKTRNYLIKVVADPAKSGVYQAVAGWTSAPNWVLYSDAVDFVDEQELKAAIDKHNTDDNSHADIRDMLVEEEQMRTAAIQTHNADTASHEDIRADIQKINKDYVNEGDIENAVNAHNQNINSHADIRNIIDNKMSGEIEKHNNDTHSHNFLLSEIDNTNSELSDLQRDFNAWIGRGGYLTAFDFGGQPTQEALTAQALAEITSITDPLQIWNGTKIVNLFDNGLWILTNTQDTDPPVFEWAYQGVNEISVFSKNMGGIIVGADPAVDPPEYVQAMPNGKGKVDLKALKNALFDMEHPIGGTIIQYPNDQEPEERGLPGKWEKWNNRVELYGLSKSLPASGGMPAYNPNATTAIAANEYRLVTQADGDQEIFQAKEAIPLTNGVIGAFDPVKWRSLGEVSTTSYRPIFVARKSVQSSWTDADLAVRTSVTYNGETYLISARHNLGGKFLSGDGGNRPPFISGGVHGDKIRNINGSFGIRRSGSGYSTVENFSGLFFSVGGVGSGYATPDVTGGYSMQQISFDASRIVPTGNENSSRTLSVRYWRRVS